MKLGPGLDLIEPIPLHGVVDIYDMNGLRIARKWPVKQKQPRTAKQKAHWERVRQANLWYHALPGWWVSAWKHINPPKYYSWHDRCMMSWWRFYEKWPVQLTAGGPHFQGWWEWANEEHTQKKCGLKFPNFNYYMWEMRNPYHIFTDSGNYIPLKWYRRGWKCYRGKKSIPIWEWDASDYSSFFTGVGGPGPFYLTLYYGEPRPIQLVNGYSFWEWPEQIFYPRSGLFLITYYIHG